MPVFFTFYGYICWYKYIKIVLLLSNSNISMTNNDHLNIIKEFDLYLQNIKGIGEGARSNYLSWTRYLMKTHDLTKIETEEDVRKILALEEMMRTSPLRKVYKKKSDITNFHSTLMKNFLPFICSYRQAQEAKRSMLTIDQMIDMIADQDSQIHAETLGEAIMLMAYNKNYIFSDEQKSRLKANMAKLGARIVVDKWFMPGVNYHSVQ